MNLNQQTQLTDEELVGMSQSGDKEAAAYILNKYKSLVRNRVRGLYLIGGEADDLLQEGMIGLFEAITDYDSGHDASFRHFAELCINRQIYTAIQASQRKKHGPLNTYVSLSADEPEQEAMHEMQLGDRIPVQMSPEDQIVDRESSEQFLKALNERLSPLERNVMDLYLAGEDYTEIAYELHKPNKSIDNALQRIKSKAKALLGSE